MNPHGLACPLPPVAVGVGAPASGCSLRVPTRERTARKGLLAEAKRHLRYGHYADGSNGEYVFCPRCRERVNSPWSALNRKDRHGLLAERLADHLSDCEVAA